MKKIIAFLVTYPIWSNVLLVSLFVFSALSLAKINSSSFPELPADKIFVNVSFPGSSPEEVEEGVILKIEDNLEGIEGIDRVTSVSQENSGSVTVELEKGYPIDDVLTDIKNAVDRISSFPGDVEKPIIFKQSEVSEAMTIVVYGETDLKTLKVKAEEIKDDLLDFKEISQVTVNGIPSLEISIEVSEEALRTYKLTFDEIAKTVKNENQNVTGGSVKTNEEELIIRSYGKKYSAKDYENFVVKASKEGGTVLLGDVAKIEEKFADVPHRLFFNGKNAVEVNVSKTNKENLVTIEKIVKKYCTTFNETNTSFRTEIINDASIPLKQRLEILINNGVMGLILIILTLTFFINLRLSFWVALGIPTAFAGMFIVIGLAGITINLISLFGMIIVVGILVDDGIVIGENIHSHIEKGKTSIQAAIDGTYEMVPAIFASVFTTIIAFIPLYFLDGRLGKFIWNVAAVVIASLCFSFVEAIFILPAHIAHSKQKNGKIENPIRAKINKMIDLITNKLYSKILFFVIEHKWFALSLPFAVLLLTLGLVRGEFIKMTFFPSIDGDTLPVRLTLDSGMRENKLYEILGNIEKAAWEVNEELKNQRPDKKDVILSIKKEIGSTTSNVGSLQIELLDTEAREMESSVIANKIHEKIGEIPEAAEFSIGRGAFFGKPVSLSLLGNDLEQLNKAKELFKEELSKITLLKNISDNNKPGNKEIKIQLKPFAQNLGLTTAEVLRQIRQGFFGQEIQRIQKGKDEIKIWTRYDSEERSEVSKLENLRIKTVSGQEFPFSEIADYKTERGIVVINHTDKKREIRVEAELVNPNEPVPPILASIEENVLPKVLAQVQGVKVRFEGQTREQEKIAASAKRAFPLALIAIVIIVILVFRSSLQAAIVFLMIPLGVIGAFLGHWFHAKPVNLLSFFGIIALAGIIVNDAIVFIDEVNRELKKGVKFRETLYNAGISRLRPILSTTFTTVAGLGPLIFEESRQAQFLIPMAISIAYGLLFGTFLILVQVPPLLLIVNKIRRLWFWLLEGKMPTEEEVEPAVKELAREKQELLAVIEKN